MSTKELHTQSVTELARALAAREVSAVETAQHFLARMKANEDLGAFVAVNEDVT
ncbi:MAG: Asp-tRNA(Asn)/Glu-tRNA(Gln) amidotransferase GatCAB subunit A, partial [Comamonadaceae bacterium]